MTTIHELAARTRVAASAIDRQLEAINRFFGANQHIEPLDLEWFECLRMELQRFYRLLRKCEGAGTVEGMEAAAADLERLWLSCHHALYGEIIDRQLPIAELRELAVIIGVGPRSSGAAA